MARVTDSQKAGNGSITVKSGKFLKKVSPRNGAITIRGMKEYAYSVVHRADGTLILSPESEPPSKVKPDFKKRFSLSGKTVSNRISEQAKREILDFAKGR